MLRSWVETAVLPTAHEIYPGGGVRNGRFAVQLAKFSQVVEWKRPFEW